MNNPNEVIIIGGGTSINEGIKLGLKDQIKGKFVIACNYAYKHFDNTFMCFVDKRLYNPSKEDIKLKHYPIIREKLKQLPLIIGLYDTPTEKVKLDNTILLKGSSIYHGQNNIKKGIYRPTLCGLFALTLAINLINFKGNVFLLGYDWTRRAKNEKIIKDTHFYKDIKHRGIGYTSFYERHDGSQYFKVYKEPNVNIYNVSPDSHLDSFAKIDYINMFELLNKESYNQNKLRQSIREQLNEK